MQQLNAEIAGELAKGTLWERIRFNIDDLESWIDREGAVFVSSLVGLTACTKAQHKRLAILWASMLPAAAALCVKLPTSERSVPSADSDFYGTLSRYWTGSIEKAK